MPEFGERLSSCKLTFPLLWMLKQWSHAKKYLKWKYFSLGAHINPSITLGMAVIRAISPLRAAMYITAQCGGGIAGAALLYG